MDLFSKRYFIWISSAFLLFSALAFLPDRSVLLISFVALLLILALPLVFRSIRPKGFALIAVLTVAAALLGSFNSILHVRGERELVRANGGERYITGYVSEVSRSAAYSSEYVICVETVSGEERSFSAILITDFDAGLSVGDFFGALAVGNGFEEYKQKNFVSNSYSSDYALVFVASDEDDVSFFDPEFRMRLILKELNADISEILTDNIEGESGNMASALLLGNRNLLPDETLRDFRRSGCYHMLALSGMHVSVIVAIFEFLLRRLYVPRWVRIGILSLLLVFYVALTGFLLSACRAMIMLWLCYLAVCLGKGADPLTSLFAAVSIIVLISPRAVLDVGLILSFLSTFGVLVASTIRKSATIFTKKIEGGRIIKGLVGALRGAAFMLLATGCTFIMTLPVLEMFFGEVSLATFITNLFIGVLAELLLAAAIAVAACGAFGYVSGAVCRFAELVGGVMESAVAWISDLRGVVLSLEYPFAAALAWGLFISFLLLLAIRLKKRILLFAPPLLFAVLMTVSVCFYGASSSRAVTLEFLSCDSGDILTLSSSDGFYICDVSGGSYSALYEGLTLAREGCHTEIEGLILTHYHSDHAMSAAKLCSRQKVRRVYLPVPQTEKELYACLAVYSELAESGTELALYNRGDLLGILGGELYVSDGVYSDGRAHPSLAISYVSGGDRVTVLENPFFNTYLESNAELMRMVSESDLLIVGGHGTPTGERFELSDKAAEAHEICFADRETVLLSDLDVGKRNVFLDVKHKKYQLKR